MFGFSWLADYLTFAPTKYPGPDEQSWDISNVSQPVEDHWITSSDNTRLHAWYLPNKGTDTAILWLHGNAGNITGRLDQAIRWVENLPVSVLLLSYRGYGKSEGSPSVKGVNKDAMAAYDYLGKLDGVKNIIIYGHSIGGAVAIELAHKTPRAGLIVEGAFTSLTEIGEMFHPYLPVKWIVGSKFNSIDKIDDIDCPKLIIHGDQDEVVPYEMGQRLFETDHNPKTFYQIKGGDHNSLLDIGGPEFLRQVRQFLSTVGNSDTIGTPKD